MQKIIYDSATPVEWDAQSAFKVTNYYADTEDHMVFCYLKQYIHNGDLKICTFCFDKEAEGCQDLQLCFNLNPEQTHNYVHMEFGIDGFCEFSFFTENESTETSLMDQLGKTVHFHSYKSNDQQGFYWCGEFIFTQQFIQQFFQTRLTEKSILLLNFYKIFSADKDHACLFPDPINNKLLKADYMQEFVVLKY